MKCHSHHPLTVASIVTRNDAVKREGRERRKEGRKEKGRRREEKKREGKRKDCEALERYHLKRCLFQHRMTLASAHSRLGLRNRERIERDRERECERLPFHS